MGVQPGTFEVLDQGRVGRRVDVVAHVAAVGEVESGGLGHGRDATTARARVRRTRTRRSATLGGRMSPLFADDNSSYRRAMRRQEAEAKRREERREQILETLRRLREKAADPAELAAEERAHRHREMLERYPPLF